jgi:hypothetical protein
MRFMLLLGMLLLLPIATAQESAAGDDPLTLIRIERAKADIKEMEELGIGTSFVKDELADAENAILKKDYQTVLEKTESISSRKQQALEILDSVRAMEIRIDDVSQIGDISRARAKFEEGKRAFNRENYAEAEDALFESERYLREVEGEYSVLMARASAARDNIFSYLEKSWRMLVLSLLLVFAIIGISYPWVSRARERSMLKNMKLERKVLGELIKKVQKEYFTGMKGSRRIYDIKIKKYRDKMFELDEMIAAYKSKAG